MTEILFFQPFAPQLPDDTVASRQVTMVAGIQWRPVQAQQRYIHVVDDDEWEQVSDDSTSNSDDEEDADSVEGEPTPTPQPPTPLPPLLPPQPPPPQPPLPEPLLPYPSSAESARATV